MPGGSGPLDAADCTSTAMATTTCQAQPRPEPGRTRRRGVPYAVAQWRRENPGEQIPDGHRHFFTQPWPAGPDGGRRDQVIYCQYRYDRARRTLRGIDEQVKKAEQAIGAGSR